MTVTGESPATKGTSGKRGKGDRVSSAPPGRCERKKHGHEAKPQSSKRINKYCIYIFSEIFKKRLTTT